jgi:hypothetical protein
MPSQLLNHAHDPLGAALPADYRQCATCRASASADSLIQAVMGCVLCAHCKPVMREGHVHVLRAVGMLCSRFVLW